MPIDARAVIAALMLVAGAASAQPESAEPPGAAPDARARDEPAAPAERAGEGSAGAPAEPFVPSESISADAVVSFPVDI